MLIFISVGDVFVFIDLIFKSACEQFYGSSSVPFAFVIVTKRISTRFFANSKQGVQNPQPGTVIDSVVTDPTK